MNSERMSLIFYMCLTAFNALALESLTFHVFYHDFGFQGCVKVCVELSMAVFAFTCLYTSK